MEKLIYTYLTRNYTIKTSQLGNDGVYPRISIFNKNHFIPVDKEILLKELNNIFMTSDDKNAEYVNLWAINNKVDVDLGFYWEEIESLFNKFGKFN